MTITTNYDALRNRVDFTTLDGYVHIGEGTDDMLRYLTRVDGEDSRYAFVCDETETAILVPPRYIRGASRNFPGTDTVEIDPDQSITEASVRWFDDDSRVAIPDTTAVAVHRELQSLTTVEVIEEPDSIWCQKNPDEVAALKEIANAVQNAFVRAESVLAAATVDGDQLVWNDERLTTDQLRAEIRKSLSIDGFSDFGNVIIGAGPSCANLHFTGSAFINPHEPVLIDMGPRSAVGYYGDMTRTFLPGTIPDWARDMYAAVEDAIKNGLEVVNNGPGITAGELYGAMAETLQSHGYETGVHETQGDTVGLTHGTGHGIGVRLHEKPFQFAGSDRVLERGNVITIEPGVYDPNRGGVRLEDVVHLTEDGCENLIDYPYQFTPVERDNN